MRNGRSLAVSEEYSELCRWLRDSRCPVVCEYSVWLHGNWQFGKDCAQCKIDPIHKERERMGIKQLHWLGGIRCRNDIVGER